MASQYFNGPVGQVVAGDSRYGSKWDLLSMDELKSIKAQYSRERTQTWLGEYFNRYATALLVTLGLFGWWGGYMIQTGGLAGDIPTTNLVFFAVFVVATAISSFGLYRIRRAAKATLAELDEDLKKINQAIRLQKTKR